MAIYGSRGFCEKCLRVDAKLHAKVAGIILCMACYSKKRLQNPEKRKAHNKRVSAYIKKNHTKVRKLQNEYFKKRYHTDEEFRLRVLEHCKNYRDRKKNIVQSPTDTSEQGQA